MTPKADHADDLPLAVTREFSGADARTPGKNIDAFARAQPGRDDAAGPQCENLADSPATAASMSTGTSSSNENCSGAFMGDHQRINPTRSCII